MPHDVVDSGLARASGRVERRIERVATADDDVADVGHHQLGLAALVIGRLPSEQVRVERGARLVVRRIE